SLNAFRNARLEASDPTERQPTWGISEACSALPARERVRATANAAMLQMPAAALLTLERECLKRVLVVELHTTDDPDTTRRILQSGVGVAATAYDARFRPAEFRRCGWARPWRERPEEARTADTGCLFIASGCSVCASISRLSTRRGPGR